MASSTSQLLMSVTSSPSQNARVCTAAAPGSPGRISARFSNTVTVLGSDSSEEESSPEERAECFERCARAPRTMRAASSTAARRAAPARLRAARAKAGASATHAGHAPGADA